MSGKIEVKKINSMHGHRDSVFALEAHRQENMIFSGAADGMVIMWDLSQENLGKIIAKVPASVYSLKYLSQSNRLIIGQNFDGLHLIDLDEKKEIKSVQLTKSYIFDIQIFGKYILVAEGQGRFIILDKETLKVLKVFDESDKSARSISVSNNLAIVGYSDNMIRVFDLKGMTKITEWKAHENSVFKVICTEDGILMSASRDAHLKFWNLEGKLIDSIIAHMYAINDIEFSPDLAYFATCSMDKSIKVWDYKKRKLLKVIDKGRHAGHGTSVNKLVWSSFNNYIVSCSDDRTLSVWELNL